jgi:hypothetical protein
MRFNIDLDARARQHPSEFCSPEDWNQDNYQASLNALSKEEIKEVLNCKN